LKFDCSPVFPSFCRGVRCRSSCAASPLENARRLAGGGVLSRCRRPFLW
jgi:hypothetical protein